MEHTFGVSLPPDDPRVEVSDKTYVALKADGMGFDAHMTVIYLGQISKLQERLASQVLEYYQRLSYYYVERLNITCFGDNNDIPVLRVRPPVGLWDLRTELKQHCYLPNPNKYEWSPHITLKLDHDYPVIIPPIIRLYDLGLY